MKRHLYTCFALFIILSTSCNNINNSNQQATILKFDLDRAILVDSALQMGNFNFTPLEMNKSCIIGRSPRMICTDSDIFIGDLFTNKCVYRFDKNGRFINKIGVVGSGPGEYIEILDYNIDHRNNIVDLLGINSEIYQYTIEGKFIKKDKYAIPPAHSFVKDLSNNYWFCIGTNKLYDDKIIYRVNPEKNEVESFMPRKSNLLPVAERNFSTNGNGIITFRESLNSSLYLIDKDITPSWIIDFGNYNLPKSLNQENSLDVAKILQQSDYAVIYTYLENKNFAYFFILLFNSGVREPTPYHWIVSKKNNEQKLYKMSQKISFSSYLMSAQILNEENELLFIGLQDAIGDLQDNNYSVASLNLSQLFMK